MVHGKWASTGDVLEVAAEEVKYRHRTTDFLHDAIVLLCVGKGGLWLVGGHAGATAYPFRSDPS